MVLYSKKIDKEIIFRFILILLGIFIGAFVCEAIARVYYVAPWYERLVEEQNRPLPTSIKLNKYGLRDADFLEEKPRNTMRVLFIGDSFTFGSGVASDDKIFPYLIEMSLNKNRDWQNIEKIEILNGGIPGSAPEQWIDLWNQVGRGYQPDVVIIVYFLRDGISYASIPHFFKNIRNNIVKSNQSSGLYRHLYLYRLFKDKKDSYKISKKYTSNFIRSYLGNERETKRWKHSQKLLLQLLSSIEEESADVGFVIFPILVELNEDYPFFEICSHIETFVRNNQIPVHNLLPAFIGQSGSSLWVSTYDQHPNEKAHKIAANSMLPFIKILLKDRLINK